jgi:hypothetical protein
MPVGVSLRIRIIKDPPEQYLEDCDVSHFMVGGTYDLRARLAELLIVLGYAQSEMRREQSPAPPAHDRRQHPR